MKMMMTARLFVKSQRKGVFGNEGNKAARTCGIVSPTIMQKAIIPPKALFMSYISIPPYCELNLGTYNAH